MKGTELRSFVRTVVVLNHQAISPLPNSHLDSLRHNTLQVLCSQEYTQTLIPLPLLPGGWGIIMCNDAWSKVNFQKVEKYMLISILRNKKTLGDAGHG